MSDQADQLRAALSEFVGADPRAAKNIRLDDLDGVLWSDAKAANGPTRWPDHLHHVVREHSDETGPGSGLFVVRFGTSIGAGPRTI
ncbi:hypothetical protein [Dactylosporangium sp. CA-092794]|uniref:hypothetical protein n=1 Tax=Dactylosporangium sp. CA-092794 TaxID=3239929 RepID=UPI003D947AF1